LEGGTLSVSNWRDSAACKGMDTRLFFPARGEPVSQAARSACAGCPVRLDCLEAALAVNERFGIWGGLPTDKRDRIRFQRRLVRRRTSRPGLARASA
jgi:WhiB family redox-sensing transcriptional regulator